MSNLVSFKLFEQEKIITQLNQIKNLDLHFLILR